MSSQTRLPVQTFLMPPPLLSLFTATRITAEKKKEMLNVIKICVSNANLLTSHMYKLHDMQISFINPTLFMIAPLLKNVINVA